jgi:hypothetical protein
VKISDSDRRLFRLYSLKVRVSMLQTRLWWMLWSSYSWHGLVEILLGWTIFKHGKFLDLPIAMVVGVIVIFHGLKVLTQMSTKEFIGIWIVGYLVYLILFDLLCLKPIPGLYALLVTIYLIKRQ